jgi:hypothetical protein
LTGQLSFEVEKPLEFVVVCARCDDVLDVVPVENGDWREAEAWCYLATKLHEPCCRNPRKVQTIPKQDT